MDEGGGVLYRAQPNKTLVQVKVCGRKIWKDRLTLALVVNMTCTDKLKHVIIYKSLRPICFGRSFANKLCVVICKPSGLDDIICILRVG